MTTPDQAASEREIRYRVFGEYNGEIHRLLFTSDSHQNAEDFIGRYNGEALELRIEKVWIRKTDPNRCPPHSWDESGEKCVKCGTKDWMT